MVLKCLWNPKRKCEIEKGNKTQTKLTCKGSCRDRNIPCTCHLPCTKSVHSHYSGQSGIGNPISKDAIGETIRRRQNPVTDLPSYHPPRSSCVKLTKCINVCHPRSAIPCLGTRPRGQKEALPDKIVNQQNHSTHYNIKLSELCNGVVNPITKETLTNYKKVINCPALRDVWLKAMCK